MVKKIISLIYRGLSYNSANWLSSYRRFTVIKYDYILSTSDKSVPREQKIHVVTRIIAALLIGAFPEVAISNINLDCLLYS